MRRTIPRNNYNSFYERRVIFTIITDKEMKEIEQLIPEHKESLVAYGAYMYRCGVFTGAAYLAIGVGLGFIIHVSRVIYKDRKSKKNKGKES